MRFSSPCIILRSDTCAFSLCQVSFFPFGFIADSVFVAERLTGACLGGNRQVVVQICVFGKQALSHVFFAVKSLLL